MQFDNNIIKIIITEVRKEKHIPPNIKDDDLINYVKEGIFSINNEVGEQIDYEVDLDARSLLKNYILYAYYSRLAEFKEIYTRDYVELQIKYNRDTNI